MSTASTVTRRLADCVTQENLLELTKFCDEAAHAVSLYFSLPSTPNQSHRTEFIAIKRLVQDVQDEFDPQALSTSLAKDLDDVLNMSEEICGNPARFWAVFACREKQLWREFGLPATRFIGQLEVGRRFRLFPLMDAMQACAPYCVLLLESGKARVFVVRGTEIQEFPDGLPAADLRLHAEDSRVGWSSHIDRDVEEHEKAYCKSLAHMLHKFMAEQQTSHVVIGCREDLWGEMGAFFYHFGTNNILGNFHLPNFAISPADVLGMATPVFEQSQRWMRTSVLSEINETPSRAAVGVGDVLRAVGEGRAQKVVVSRMLKLTIPECQDCGRMREEANRKCIFCGSARIGYAPAEENLIRQALLSHAEIFVEQDAVAGFSGAAALLRY